LGVRPLTEADPGAAAPTGHADADRGGPRMLADADL